MTMLRKILKFIDSLSEHAGSLGKWFAFLLVLIGSFDAIARALFQCSYHLGV